MRKVRLGDVFSLIRNGANIKQGLDDSGYPITRIETISDRTVNREKMGYAGIADNSIYDDYILQDGDILMSHINSEKHLGKTAIYKKQKDEKIIHGMNLLCLRPDNSQILPEYAFYFLSSNNFLRQIPNITKKSVNQASFTVTALKELSFTKCGIDEQKKIVCELDKVTDLIDKRKKQLSKLDELVKARFVELFGDPITNPMEWELHRFDSLCENLDYRRQPITASEREVGIYPYYGASGVVDYVADYLFDEDILLISEDGANLLMRSTPIAFSVSGKVWVNNHAHVVKFEKMSMQKYIEVFFSLIDVSDHITGSAQPKLNQAKLNAMMFPVPSDERLDAFLQFVKQTDKSKLAIQKSLEKLELLKKALMQKYFG